MEITCTVHASPRAEVSKEFEENQDFLGLAHQRIQVFKLMMGWNKKIIKKVLKIFCSGELVQKRRATSC